MSWPAPIFIDGQASTAKRIGIPQLTCPIPGVNTAYVLTEPWQQLLVDQTTWTPLSLNTAHPEYSGFVLVEETPLQDLGNAYVRWNRIYGKVPAQHSEWEMFAYSFIGFNGLSGVNVPIIPGRPRQVFTVPSRVQYDYVMVPTTPWSDPIFGSYNVNSPGDIKTVEPMYYVYQTSYLGAVYGGILLQTDALNPSNSTSPTVPNQEKYKVMLTDALSNGWNAGLTVEKINVSNTWSGAPPSAGSDAGTIDVNASTFAGQIPAEASRLTRWKGNIWQRQSRWVLAQ